MTIHEFTSRWKDSVSLSFATVALLISLVNFYQANIREVQDVHAHILDVKYLSDGERVTAVPRIVVVNRGNRDATIVELEFVVEVKGQWSQWNNPTMFAVQEPFVLRTNEVRLLELNAPALTKDDYLRSESREIGLRTLAIDSHGQSFSITFPIGQISTSPGSAAWAGGPKSEYDLLSNVVHKPRLAR